MTVPSLEFLAEKLPKKADQAANRIRELQDDVLKAFDNYVLHGYDSRKIVRMVLYQSDLTEYLGAQLGFTFRKKEKTPKQLASILLRKSSIRNEKTINCYNIRGLFKGMLHEKISFELKEDFGFDYKKTIEYVSSTYHTMVEMIQICKRKKRKK